MLCKIAIDSVMEYDMYIDTRVGGIKMKTAMAKVKVSPKFQIVIPKAIREEMRLQPGQELLLYLHDGTLRLNPPRSIRELRGIAKGIRWEPTDRDRNDRY